MRPLPPRGPGPLSKREEVALADGRRPEAPPGSPSSLRRQRMEAGASIALAWAGATLGGLRGHAPVRAVDTWRASCCTPARPQSYVCLKAGDSEPSRVKCRALSLRDAGAFWGGVGGPWLLLGAPGPPTSPPAPLNAEDAPWCLLLSRELGRAEGPSELRRRPGPSSRPAPRPSPELPLPCSPSLHSRQRAGIPYAGEWQGCYDGIFWKEQNDEFLPGTGVGGRARSQRHDGLGLVHVGTSLLLGGGGRSVTVCRH